MSRLLLCLLLAIFAVPRARAETAEELYRQGKWPEAAAAFRESLGDPSSDSAAWPVLYNYGTALARSGASGEAYAVLLKAYFKNPLDGDLKFNLAFVERSLPGAGVSIRPASWFLWWPGVLRSMGTSLWALLCLAALAPALWLLGSGRKSPVSTFSLALAGIFIVIGGLSLVQSRFPVAAITGPTKLRSGPNTSFQEISSLETGALVNVEDSRDGWHKVRFQTLDSKETVGWIPAGASLRVLP